MYWRNSSFQIRHFLAGKCHTADEAYRLLRELEEEREQALHHATFSGRKLQLRLSLLHLLRFLPLLGIWARIEIDRINTDRPRIQRLIDAAMQELQTIRQCLAEVAPHRAYAHMPDPLAHQACQEAEWLAELKWRAENYLLTGAIPADQLSAMRLHPAFTSEIWPHIQAVRTALTSQEAMPLPGGTKVAALLGAPHADH